MKEKCKVIGYNNREMDGDFVSPKHRYGYCQIHKIYGTVTETTQKGIGRYINNRDIYFYGKMDKDK